jgi:uncharacterized protein with NRDE domain
MCLIAFAHRAAPGIELLVAANRDEFFERPSVPARFWEDRPGILAGRDLLAGGTWLGIAHRPGQALRFAAITNYRDPGNRRDAAPSRGALVSDFLSGRQSAADYLADLAPTAADYNGFSLLVSDGAQLWFSSNRDGAAYRVGPGIHGLSNHLLNEPWPKVKRAKQGLARILAEPFEAEDCFALLADETQAPDIELPRTGLALERERNSSAIRIRDPVYGTRCSTVLLLRDSGEVEFHERSFAPEGGVTGTVSHSFTLQPATAASPRGESPPPRTSGRAR